MKKNYFIRSVVALVLAALLFVPALHADNKEAAFHSKKIFRGYQTESNFGANTVNIGDFNADGFEDLAISADNDNDGAGKVYIYFGGNKADRKPDAILSPKPGEDAFGYKMAPAGDFNGDGFADLVVVSKNFGSQNPEIMVYFGGPAWDNRPDVSLENHWGNSGFGNDVAGLGDVNGDGMDDIGVISGTSVALYYGSLGLSGTKNMDKSLNQAADHIAYCGDVNGDGYNDILNASTSEGYVFIYKGGPHISNDPNVFFIRTNNDSPSFGFSMSAVGDINGDGLTDVVVGDMNGASNYGEAFVYLGSPKIFDGFDTKHGWPADFTLTGPSSSSDFGSAVAIVKDMNGDGMDEFAIAGSNLTTMNLYYGSHRFSPVPSQVYKVNDEGYFYGITSMDFDGDGYNEVLGSDYEQDVVYSFNNETRYVNSDCDVSLQDNNDLIVAGGDINGDGEDDFITYDYNFENGKRVAKNIKFYLGGSKFTGKPVYSWSCYIARHLDDQVRFVGDFNGDGIGDFMMGYVMIYGKKNMSAANPPDTSIIMNDANGMITHGDYNNDGYGDIVMRDTANHIHVIYGGPSPETVQVNSLQVEVYPLTLDLNGDGIDDLILGELEQSTLRIYYGRDGGFKHIVGGIIEDSRVYLDRDLPNVVRLWRLELLGDVNGDGIDEFLVGYYNVSDNVVVKMARSNAKELSEWKFKWVDEPYAFYAAGDVNHDGIDDALIQGGNKSYVFFGHRGFGNIEGLPEDMVITARPLFSDINGDGYEDFYYPKYLSPGIKFYFGSAVNVAPYIVSVADVPYDQGGKVTLSWFKSGWDGGKVKTYRIERSIAPVGSGFAWETIGSVQAGRKNYYSFTAPTLNDSMQGNPGNTYFRVTALTGDDDVFYPSGIRFGHSTDNLAPAAVQNLKAVPQAKAVKVSWQLNSENDMKEYRIYRSMEKEPDFDTLKVYGVSADSLFLDQSPLDGPVYYFVRPVDIHQNAGEVSSVLLDVTGVNDLPGLPESFELGQNFPNPFVRSTVIRFSLPRRARVNLAVYNVRGEQIAQLVNCEMGAGVQSVTFDAPDLPAGIYFYCLRAGDFVARKKMLMVK